MLLKDTEQAQPVPSGTLLFLQAVTRSGKTPSQFSPHDCFVKLDVLVKMRLCEGMFRIAFRTLYSKFLPQSRQAATPPTPLRKARGGIQIHRNCIRFLSRHLKVDSTFRLSPKPGE